MGYAEKIQKLCALRGLDQSSLAEQVHVSKASMSRIMSGMQEPKLRLAHELARALGVTLDYLVDDALRDDPAGQLVLVTEDELTILKIARRLGVGVAIDRMLEVGAVKRRHAATGRPQARGKKGSGKRPGSRPAR